VGGGVLVSGFVVLGFFSVVVVPGFLVGAGSFLAQPLSVNATNTRPANAVRTTLLMVIPFRKTVPFYCLLTSMRAKTLDTPLNYHRQFTKASGTRHRITLNPNKDQDKIP
jgi:hypothetical protein